MTYRPPEPRPERKHFYAGQLTDEQVGRELTVAAPSWPVRGHLQAVELDQRAGLVVLTVHRRDGRQNTVTVPPDTGVIVHRKQDPPA